MEGETAMRSLRRAKGGQDHKMRSFKSTGKDGKLLATESHGVNAALALPRADSAA